MKRVLTGTMTVALTGAFLVGDVVSLPAPAQPVEPVVQEVALGGTGGVPMTAASASPLRRLVPAAEPTTSPVGPSGADEPVAVDDAAAQEPVEATDPGSTTAAQSPQDPESPAATDGAAAPAGAEVFESAVVETQDFTIAGVTWDATSVEDPTDIQVRVREDDGWSEWTSLQVNDEGPDAGTAEYEQAAAVSATDPVVSAGADAVQVRLDAPGGEVPTGLEVVVIDPGASPGDSTLEETAPLASADAATARPRIITRAQWGADESKRRCSTSSYSSTVKAATIHHTAGTNSYTAAQSAGVVRGIYAYHTGALGWCDVGYNFLVDKYGQIFEGRRGGVERPVIGAHAGGFNRDTVGVSAMGDYSKVAAPAVMVNAIADVVAWKLSLHGVDPKGTVALTSAGGTSKYSAGTRVTLPRIFGHRDTGKTTCPGNYLYQHMAAIRTRAAAAAGEPSFVRSLYIDMLGRTPSDWEIAYWVPSVGAPNGRAVVAGGFAGSQEYRKKAITAAYVDVLNRQPDAQGLEHWYQSLLAGRAKVDDIRPVYLASREFLNQAGGTDSGWIQLLFRRSLGRGATDGDVRYWRARLAVVGRDRVIKEIYDSPESAGIRVDRAYRAWLGRTAGGWERTYWSNLVATQGDEVMRQAVMVSEEYYKRAPSR